MTRRIGIFLVLVLILVVSALLGLASLRGGGARVRERMAACPGSPNCVSSKEERSSHRVEPLSGAGDPAELFQRAVEVVRALPRTRVVTREEGYLHAECRSALFRFVDDLELELDAEAGVVHVRSASRVGRSDLGVNRRRVERIRSAVGAGVVPST